MPLVEASAYLDLTAAAVRYRVSGLRREADGGVTIVNGSSQRPPG